MTPVPDWTERGSELAETLDRCFAVVVVGGDSVATAEVALGIGRAQAVHRRVAVVDLFGGAPPLQALLTSDDPHGIVDSFEFGVSINRIAHEVAGAGALFVIPTGTVPIDYATMLANARWRRLAGGFREVGALLVLAAPANAESLAELVLAMDGAVVVGDTVPPDVPVAQTLAWLRETRRSSVAAPPREAPLAVVEAAREHPRGIPTRYLAGAAGLLLTAGFIAAGVWFANRPFASAPRPRTSATPETSPLQQQLAAPAVTPPPDTSHPDTASNMVIAPLSPDSFPLLAPINKGDSAKASSWAVALGPTRTKGGAILDLRTRFETVPVGTYGIDVRTRSFLLVAGAYPLRTSAESLLTDLRNHRTLAPGIGSVMSLPFAFLVQQDVPEADVPARLRRFAGSAHPVYALRQTNGVANLYFGAYESAQQAALAVPAVREAGLTPTLVYRIGRVF